MMQKKKYEKEKKKKIQSAPADRSRSDVVTAGEGSYEGYPDPLDRLVN